MQASVFHKKKLRCFRCDISGCHNAFRSYRGLIVHLRKHLKATGSKPHSATYLNDTSAQGSKITTKDEEGLLHCKLCDRMFTQSSNLLRHERIHRGEKPHECLKCNKKFSTSSNLKQHMLTHQTTKDKRNKYVCKVCKNSYLYRASLKKHMRQHMYLDLSPEHFVNARNNKTPKNKSSEYETQTKKVRLDAEDSINRNEPSSNLKGMQPENILGLYANMQNMIGLQGSPHNMTSNPMMNPFMWAMNGNIQSLPINPNFWSNPQGHPPIQNPRAICPFKELIHDYRVTQGLKGLSTIESGIPVQREMGLNSIQRVDNKEQQFPMNIQLSNLFARISEPNPNNASRRIFTPSGSVVQMNIVSDPVKKEEA